MGSMWLSRGFYLGSALPIFIIDRDKPEELFGRHKVSETITNRTGYIVKIDA